MSVEGNIGRGHRYSSTAGKVASDPKAKAKKKTEATRSRNGGGEIGPKTRARMNKFLAFRAQGMTVDQACAELGISTSAYTAWRRRDQKFAADASRITARTIEGWKPPEKPFDAEWREEYFGHVYRSKPVTPWHLERIISFLHQVGPGETALILLPPEHAKTTIGEDFLCHEIAENPNIRSSVISKGESHAKRILGRIQERMTDRDLYQKFHEDYGPFKDEQRKGKPWSTKFFKVLRNNGGERDYSLGALGFRGQLYGQRQDLIWIDDIVDPNEPPTPEVTQKICDWIRSTVYSRIGTQGRLFVAGTRVDEDDVYKQLMDEEFFDHVLVLAAFDEECSDGRPAEYLWPQRFPPEHYAKVRTKVGERIWTLVHQQAGVVEFGMTFPKTVIEGCYIDERAQHVPFGWIPVVGVDPASANWTAGVCLAFDPRSHRRRVIDVWKEKDLTGDGGDRTAGLMQFIVSLCTVYGAKHLGLEENSAWTLLSSSLSLRQQLTENNITMHKLITKSGGTAQSTQGVQGDLEISQLSSLFFNQMVELPAQGTSKQVMSPLVTQLSRWKPQDKKRPKDVVKAFQFAEYAVRRVMDQRQEAPKVEGRNMPAYVQRQQREVFVG